MMNQIHQKMIRWMLALLLGIPLGIFLSIEVEHLLIVDNGHCYEYAYPSLSWFWDVFFGGYHHDPTLLYYSLILVFGVYCAEFVLSKIARITVNHQ